MSEKRFSFNGIYFVDNETGQMSHNATEKTLNLLYDEYIKLRNDLDDYGDANATLEAEILKLRKENNELKLILKQHEFAEKEGFK